LTSSLENDNFIRACWRKETDYTPVWFMRQAGRYLESYRKVRAQHDVLEICKTPKLAAQVTVEAAQELGVDAAIIFADIMLPLEGAGIGLKIVDGGPQIDKPVRNNDNKVVEKLESFVPEEDVPYVLETARLVKSNLDDGIPVIGFSGAPFTLASYLIEGGPSRDFTETKRIMYDQSEFWNSLLSHLSNMVSSYLLAQVHAGVDAVQLFDSWSGCLSPVDYEEFVLPYTKRIFQQLEGRGVPRIHFGVGTAGLLDDMRETESDVYGVDWRIPLDEAWKILGDDKVAIQGNLDPATLLSNWTLVESRTTEILSSVKGRRGHVFNLGHGVLPSTDPLQLKKLVRLVQRTTRR